MSQQSPTSTSSPEKKSGKSFKIVVSAVVVIALVALVLIASRPRPEITRVSGYESFRGLNYVFKVDVTAKNNGAGGWVKVYAEISGAHLMWFNE